LAFHTVWFAWIVGGREDALAARNFHLAARDILREPRLAADLGG
jgi:hypothetical protein